MQIIQRLTYEADTLEVVHWSCSSDLQKIFFFFSRTVISKLFRLASRILSTMGKSEAHLYILILYVTCIAR
jgi:hypothetical protein